VEEDKNGLEDTLDCNVCGGFVGRVHRVSGGRAGAYGNASNI
jgi:hypothetical protein